MHIILYILQFLSYVIHSEIVIVDILLQQYRPVVYSQSEGEGTTDETIYYR